MKEFIYKCFGFELSQMKWYRKWYGGLWSKVDLTPHADILVWTKGCPDLILGTIIQTESY